jgi:hypothetical protein
VPRAQPVLPERPVLLEQTVRLSWAPPAQQVPAQQVPREFRVNPEARGRSVQPEKQGQVGVAVLPVQPERRVRQVPSERQVLRVQPVQQVLPVLSGQTVRRAQPVPRVLPAAQD